ncbi:protein kinase [bacterium]|nr:protein kinase [bacterium]MCI0604512.1 protein kinase [bacterium]
MENALPLPVKSDMALARNTNLGPYEIQDLIGAGGMGEVYRARDTRLNRSVAVKVLPASFAEDIEQRMRLEREARAAGMLNHPNVLVIFDIGTHEGSPYVVTELLEGESLRDMITQGPIALQTAMTHAVQIASGLSAAHEKSIIHRDLKPDNIFLTSSGIVKILDFGLAKIDTMLKQETTTNLPTQSLTQPGSLLGTVAYMSPEQARGQLVDARSDIFSFGVVLFEMVSGRRPFQGQTATDILTAILRDEPDFSDFPQPLFGELQRILLHALAKDPEARFQNARELVFALRIIEAELLAQSNRQGQAMISHQKKGDFRMAVLPFLDLSAEKDQQYFCDGMTEELISALTKVEGLRVVSRTSAFQFQGQRTDIRRIGQQLGVGAILDGSVRKSGSRIRITAELINVQDGFHLWSERYDREIADVFDIQDEIARTIVDTLKLELVGSKALNLVPRYTDNQEAYNLYLKGRYYWNKRSRDGVERAIEYFNQAIEKDQSYAIAYSGLADCYSIMGFYAYLKPAEMYSKAKAAAETALRLDSNLPEGHLSMGAVYLYFEMDWQLGHRCMRRSLELNPAFALGHCWYSGFLSLLGQHREAREHAQKALQLDPLSPLFCYFYGFCFYNDRRYDEALQQFHSAFEIEPDFLVALWCSAQIYLKKRMYEMAIRAMEKVCAITNRSPFYVSYLALAYAEAGATGEAERLLGELQQRAVKEYVPPFSYTRIYMGLRKLDEAFEELKKAIAEKNVIIYMFQSPEFDMLRADARYESILGTLKP